MLFWLLVVTLDHRIIFVSVGSPLATPCRKLGLFSETAESLRPANAEIRPNAFKKLLLFNVYMIICNCYKIEKKLIFLGKIYRQRRHIRNISFRDF